MIFVGIVVCKIKPIHLLWSQNQRLWHYFWIEIWKHVKKIYTQKEIKTKQKHLSRIKNIFVFLQALHIQVKIELADREKCATRAQTHQEIRAAL